MSKTTTMRFGDIRFRVQHDSGKTYLLISPWLMGFPACLSVGTRKLALSEYTTIFTDHEYDENSGGDRYTVRLMKPSWKQTVKLRTSSESTFHALVAGLSSLAAHLKVRRGPPANSWGNDERPWWAQWD